MDIPIGECIYEDIDYKMNNALKEKVSQMFIDINDVEDLFFAYDKYNSIEEKIADNFEYIYSEFCNDDGKDLIIDLFNSLSLNVLFPFS